MTALGAALSVLHAQPTDGFEPFTRLDPDQVAAAGHLVCAARPDLSPLAEALVGVLLLTAPAPGPGVLLHGDLHPKNVLVHDSGVSLVDLDQAGVGPAGAELGGTLARLWHPRPGTRSTPTRPRPPARPCSRRTTVRRLATTCSGTPRPPSSSSGRPARSSRLDLATINDLEGVLATALAWARRRTTEDR